MSSPCYRPIFFGARFPQFTSYDIETYSRIPTVSDDHTR